MKTGDSGINQANKVQSHDFINKFLPIESIDICSKEKTQISLSSTNDFILLKKKLEEHWKSYPKDKLIVDILLPFSIYFKYNEWKPDHWKYKVSSVEFDSIFILSKNNKFLYNFYEKDSYLHITFQNHNEAIYLYQLVDHLNCQSSNYSLKVYASGCSETSCEISEGELLLDDFLKSKLTYNERIQQFICLNMDMLKDIQLSSDNKKIGYYFQLLF